MDCLKSFNIRIEQATNCTNSNGTIRTWGTAGEYNFSLVLDQNNTKSLYDLQGFKRTDIYGVSVVGYVMGFWASGTKCALVNDWSTNLTLDGTSPLISGFIGASNGFGIKTTSPGLNTFALSKHTPSIMFSSPFSNVKEIKFENLLVQGTGAEFLNEVFLLYDLTYTFYYQYEGE